MAFPAGARVEFAIEYADASGEGFFDDTPRSALADNPGTTLGEQRRLAFEHALEIWARALSSPVPVRIEATFSPFPELPCERDAAVLGAARAEAAFSGFRGAPRTDVFYPSPLADKLAGFDLDPMEPDLTALLNPRVDDDDCLGRLGWDYSMSGQGGEAGLVSTVLHELAHGLGFASLVDELTGSAGGGLSIFDAFLLDRGTGLTWDVMTNEQRQHSVSSPYDLVWLGERVTAAAPDVLARGAPSLLLSDGEEITALAEPSFPPFLGASESSGELLALGAAEACEGDDSLAGTLVLLSDGAGCADLLTQIGAVARRGAEAALTRSLYAGAPPWGTVSNLVRADIPSLALTHEQFDALVERLSAGPLSGTLRTDGSLLGTDAEGRVRLSATDPVQPGSSGSHWDASVRRGQASDQDPVGLLMEPAAAGRFDSDVSDLSVQLLQDIGWDDPVCGNRILEHDEECDDGIANSDVLGDACRSDCRVPYCGDGVVDQGEQCDPGQSRNCTDQCERPVLPGPEGADGGSEPEPRPDPGPARPSDAGAEDGGDGGRELPDAPDSGPPPHAVERGCACRTRGGAGASGPLLGAAVSLLLWRRRARLPDREGRSRACRS